MMSLDKLISMREELIAKRNELDRTLEESEAYVLEVYQKLSDEAKSAIDAYEKLVSLGVTVIDNRGAIKRYEQFNTELSDPYEIAKEILKYETLQFKDGFRKILDEIDLDNIWGSAPMPTYKTIIDKFDKYFENYPVLDRVYFDFNALSNILGIKTDFLLKKYHETFEAAKRHFVEKESEKGIDVAKILTYTTILADKSKLSSDFNKLESELTEYIKDQIMNGGELIELIKAREGGIPFTSADLIKNAYAYSQKIEDKYREHHVAVVGNPITDSQQRVFSELIERANKNSVPTEVKIKRDFGELPFEVNEHNLASFGIAMYLLKATIGGYMKPEVLDNFDDNVKSMYNALKEKYLALIK